MSRCRYCDAIGENLMKFCFCPQNSHYVHSLCFKQMVYRISSDVCGSVRKNHISVETSESELSWKRETLVRIILIGLLIWAIVSPLLALYSNGRELYVNGIKCLDILNKNRGKIDSWKILSQLIIPVLTILSSLKALHNLWIDYKKWRKISVTLIFKRN